MTVYNVVFNARLFTRKSNNTYTHAAFNANRKGNRPWVTFHGTEAAARKAAGAFGQVKPVTVIPGGGFDVTVPAHGVCIVCLGRRYIDTRMADGRMVTDPCYRCNQQ